MLDFWKNKRILVTGHTGFKGSWLTEALLLAGAEVTGYALEPPTDPSLFELLKLKDRMRSVTGDVRDLGHLLEVFRETQPEFVLHMAAQPIVRLSYREPVMTYETNVMGTVNICECVRQCPGVRSFLNVTTDKVYENGEKGTGFVETDRLDGYDPYSNSKSCSELVTHGYTRSFLKEQGVAVSTARAGNVIGGGDFAPDRIVPDCVRAAQSGSPLVLRNPDSVRPFQHVLEPLAVYLLIAQKQYTDKAYAGFYNVGPDDCDCLTTGELTELFCRCWGEGAAWETRAEENAPHEAGYLRLDCEKIKKVFSWQPRWHMEKCMEMVCRFSKVWLDGGDIPAEMDREIEEFIIHN